MNLSIFLIEATDVPKADLLSESDPYCIFSVTGIKETQQSKYIDDTKNPKWNETFAFFIKDNNADVLHIDLMDKDIGVKDDKLASVDIPLKDLPANKEVEKWYSMTVEKKYNGSPKVHLSISLCK